MPIERIFPVVIARHSTALLELTLSSLREFTEVIVHAPAASDELIALCDWYRNTHIIVRDDQLGGSARNHGAGAAAGEWILALTAGELRSQSEFGLLAAATLLFAWVVDLTFTPALCRGLRVVPVWDRLFTRR